MKRKRHCSTCTCGLTCVGWSDRSAWVDLSDNRDIARAIIGCALDHFYDRSPTGIPWAMPEWIEEACAPIVARALSSKNKSWKRHTVEMTTAEQDAFKAALVAALKGARP